MAMLKRQLPLNLGVNIVNFLVGLLAGIWMTPYLISALGVAAYGLIPLAMVLAEYVALITTSINGAISRFLTIAIQQQRTEEATRIFSTAFFFLSAVVVVLTPMLGWVSYNVHHLIKVPAGYTQEAASLLFMTFLGFLLSIMSAIFSSSLYANNRLDLCRVIDITRVVVRVVVIIGCFSLLEPTLRYVGYANFAGGAASLLVSILLSRRMNPLLRITARSFDSSQLKTLVSFGGWTVISQLGHVLFARLDLVLANLLTGAVVAGKYAALLQWTVLLQSLAGLLAGVCAPVVLILYSRGQYGRLVEMVILAIKLMAMTIAIPAGLLCGFAVPLLRFWLGPSFTPYASLFWITIAPLVIILGVTPLFAVQNAYKQIMVPSLVMVLLGLINIPAILLLVNYTSLGIYAICLSGAVLWVVKCGLFNTLHNAHFTMQPRGTFLRPLLPGIVTLALAWAAALLCQQLIVITSPVVLAICAVVIALLLATLVVTVLLGRADRDELQSVLRTLRSSNSVSEMRGNNVHV